MLILAAWTVIPPDRILQEIEISMTKFQISKKGFTLKTLTPVFYSMRDRLVDQDYYCHKELDFKYIKEKEQKLDKEVKELLYEF